MSVRAVAYMKELSVCPNGEMITRTEKLVGIVLADNHQDRVNKPTFPGVDSIAEDALVSERQCQRVFASLERKGVIRREYPAGPGRGKTTYYFFVELERKGCHDVTLYEGERVTEGCQKGDISRTPILSNKNKSNVKPKTPQPPFPKGASVSETPAQVSTNGGAADAELERAVDQVMDGCGFMERRVRRVVRDVIAKSEPPDATARAMIQAWTEYTLNGDLLRVRVGPYKFFALGYWRSQDSWAWDKEALDRLRNATVGRFI